jgi:GNAT superfamily N-acetyltransferase
MTTPDVTVRILTLEDVLSVVRVANQAFLEHARLPGHAAMAVRYISEYPGWQWGVFQDGRLVGFLLGEPRPDQKRAGVRLIASDPGVKGRGLGSRLIGELEARARREGFEKLSVGTPFARSFYEKNGFVLTVTNLKMIREIACRAVTAEGCPAARALDFAAAAEVVRRLGDDALRRGFLSAFLANVRHEQALTLLLGEPEAPRGVVVGRSPESCPDLAEAVFHHAFDGALAPLVRAFELAASNLGLRYVGFEVPEERGAEMEQLGYARSERDFYWTMYTLEKRLGG